MTAFLHKLHMQTNWSTAHTQLPLSWSSNTQSHYPPALLTIGPGNRQLATVPTPYSLLKLFKLANPKPPYPCFPIPSQGNHNKGSCPHCPLTPSVSRLTLVFPFGSVWWGTHPPLRNCEWQNIFQWQLSPDLRASPYLNNNKTSILKPSGPTNDASLFSNVYWTNIWINKQRLKAGNKEASKH